VTEVVPPGADVAHPLLALDRHEAAEARRQPGPASVR
jgi:hypothetical protein